MYLRGNASLSFISFFHFIIFEKKLEDISPVCGTTDTPVLDFWLRLLCISKLGWITCLHASSPTCSGILRSPPREDIPRANSPPTWADTRLRSACWDTVNKRAVRIPLECILVCILFLFSVSFTNPQTNVHTTSLIFAPVRPMSFFLLICDWGAVHSCIIHFSFPYNILTGEAELKAFECEEVEWNNWLSICVIDLRTLMGCFVNGVGDSLHETHTHECKCHIALYLINPAELTPWSRLHYSTIDAQSIGNIEPSIRRHHTSCFRLWLTVEWAIFDDSGDFFCMNKTKWKWNSLFHAVFVFWNCEWSIFNDLSNRRK